MFHDGVGVRSLGVASGVVVIESTSRGRMRRRRHSIAFRRDIIDGVSRIRVIALIIEWAHHVAVGNDKESRTRERHAIVWPDGEVMVARHSVLSVVVVTHRCRQD